MAIVQVSRITNRKGLTDDLPQLAGAEFGWCIDSRRLFIGNGTLEAGAPVIGNTEILTEFSDITTLSSYTYQDSVVGYTVQTGPTPSSPVVRTVQAKLDDFADVRDFGAVGDGVADDTAAINRALYQLYCREANTQIRRSLYFPAGTYLVSDTILIPTYAKLLGEGADCSIILLAAGSAVSYVAQYADSLQQTGVNIGNNGATAPRNIEISSMTFQAEDAQDIFLIEDAVQCYFDSVNFRGPLTTTSITSNLATDNAAGVRFASTTSQVCTQITFDRCRFAGLTYGINTDQQISGITVSNSDFDTLFQGILLGTGTPINGGATGFRAVQNTFDNIYGEGIIYDQVSLNATAYNVFYSVGNNYTTNPTTPLIQFGYDNNVSVGDLFERTDDEDNVVARVSVTGSTNTTATAIGNAPGAQTQLGRYSRRAGQTFTLAGSTGSATPIFTISSGTVKAWKMDYTISNIAGVRTGALLITCDGLVLNFTDDYDETADTGVSLSPTLSAGDVTVKYTNSGATATLTYSISHLA